MDTDPECSTLKRMATVSLSFVSDSPPPPQSAAAYVIPLFSAQAAALPATDSHGSTMLVNQNLPVSKHKAGGAVIISSSQQRGTGGGGIKSVLKGFL